jgi:hypothetical protein
MSVDCADGSVVRLQELGTMDLSSQMCLRATKLSHTLSGVSLHLWWLVHLGVRNGLVCCGKAHWSGLVR